MSDLNVLNKTVDGEKENLKAKKVNQGAIASDVAKVYGGKAGLSQSEKNQLVDQTTQQAGAGMDAQNQEMAQAGLAAGGGGPNARYAALQRELQGGVADATAQANSEAERIHQAKALSEKASVDARLAQEEAITAQRTQYWTSTLFSGIGGLLDMGGAGGASVNASAGG